jgi:hypothetical protein
MSDEEPEEYDGLYFLPGDEDNELKIQYFVLSEEYKGAEKVNHNEIGDCFHVAFFKPDEDGCAKFDEHFEAIFADPSVYLDNLVGGNLFGCMLRKTTKSGKWFEEYLTRAKNYVKIQPTN